MLKIGMEYPEMNTKKPHRFRNSHFAQISIFLVILFFAPGAEISNVIYKGIPYKLQAFPTKMIDHNRCFCSS